MSSDQIEQLKKEVDEIKARNKRVEAEKAWETSGFRIVSLTALSYVVTAIAFFTIGIENFLLQALIPTAAYITSTLSLPILKKAWLKRNLNTEGK